MYNETKSVLAPRVRFQFPHDPVRPKIVSRFPGPAHQAAIEKVSATQCIDGQHHLQRFINNDLSKGNYFRDTDNNTVLDLDCPLALGYNNDAFINARDSPIYDRFL